MPPYERLFVERLFARTYVRPGSRFNPDPAPNETLKVGQTNDDDDAHEVRGCEARSTACRAEGRALGLPTLLAE